MKNITLQDKEFSLFIPASDIRLTVRRIADKINEDYAGKEVVLLPIMNGAMVFASDLMRKIKVPCKVSCIKLSSYRGTTSTGKIDVLVDFDKDFLAGKNVIVIEDIVDSGVTVDFVVNSLKTNVKPATIAVAALLFKPQGYISKNLTLNYVGYEISDHFVVGYGLDYNGYGRQYEDIYRII